MPRYPLRLSHRVARRATILALAVVVSIPSLGAAPSAGQTATTVLQLDRTIRTTPFVHSQVSMADGEGGAYVPADDSLWLADDNRDAVYEIDPSTGEVKRTIDTPAFEKVHRFGGGAEAGPDRVVDFESMAYDEHDDVLYVFSGICCNSTSRPAVFRLVRRNGVLKLDSFQPLGPEDDFSAAGWNAVDRSLYVAVRSDLHAYDYATNTVGSAFQITGVTGILGLGFSADGSQAFMATNHENLDVIDWASRTLVPGWSFDLTAYGMLDARAVDEVGGQLFVLDGAGRPEGDPLRFAVFVFDVVQTSTVATSFTAKPSSGTAPLMVSFQDTSTGGPTSWTWDLGDGTTATTATVTHVYAAPGTYTVTLTNGNAFGTSSAQTTVEVRPATCDGTRATVVGTSGDDVLRGTSGADVFQGRGGDDVIQAGLGNDLACGGGGSDTIVGGGGRDRLLGQAGDDVLKGGDGADVLDGGAGLDVGNGGPGDDACRGVERRRSC
jgi:hypothetical protein